MVGAENNFRLLLDVEVTVTDLPLLAQWVVDHLDEASGLAFVDEWTDPTDPDDTNPEDVILEDVGEAAYPLNSSWHMLDVLLQVVLRGIPGIELYELTNSDVTSVSNESE